MKILVLKDGKLGTISTDKIQGPPGEPGKPGQTIIHTAALTLDQMISLKGADGHTPTPDELTALIQPLIPPRAELQGADGHTPTPDELTALIQPLIPSREELKGEPGKNAEPPSAKFIETMLAKLIPPIETLKGLNGHTPTPDELTSLIQPLIPSRAELQGEPGQNFEFPTGQLGEVWTYTAKGPAWMPNSSGSGHRMRFNSIESRIAALEVGGGGGGSSTFLGLTDTPSSYAGQGLKVVRVNAGATALEFGVVLGTAATSATGDFDAAGAATSAVATHEAAGDPHPQYLTAAEGGSAYQPLDAELSAIAGLTSAADKGIQFTGSGTAATYDLTTAGKALLDDADATAQRATLGLVIGTNVQAFDAELSAIAGLTSAADKAPYFTGSGTAALADLTTFGRSLIDDANAAAAVTTLGLDNTKIDRIVFTFDGGGSAISVGAQREIEIPFACTINRATLLLDQSGSIVIDLKKDTYANYPPTTSITASAKPTVSSATKSQDSTLTGWTTSIAAGDVLKANVDSITTATRATLILKVTKT